MKLDSCLEHSGVLDGVGDNDLLLVDIKAFLLEAVGDILCGNSAVKPAVSSASGNDLEYLAVKDLLGLLCCDQCPALMLGLSTGLKLNFIKIC